MRSSYRKTETERIDNVRVRFPRVANVLVLLLGLAGFARLAPQISRHALVILVCLGMTVFALLLWNPVLTVIGCVLVTTFFVRKLRRATAEKDAVRADYERKMDDEIPF